MTNASDFSSAQEQDFNRRNIAEFQANGGKVGGPFDGVDLLLLHTVGAKSGQPRLHPLAYFDIDGARYIVGSAAGRDADPAWVANVRANPEVRIEVGGAAPAAARVRKLPDAERNPVFAEIARRSAAFAAYQDATDRVIPVFEVLPA